MSSPESWQHEQISCAFILAVATRAGYTLSDWKVDKDGVDVTIRRGGLMVDMQLKCSYSARSVRDGYAFDLDIATYNKLRHPDRSAPGYLGLVVVPPDLETWIIHNEEEVLLRCVGYYAQIQGRGEARTEKTTAIHLPRRQLINGPGLDEMFKLSLLRARHGSDAGMVA